MRFKRWKADAIFRLERPMLNKAARRKKYRPENHPDPKRAAELRLKQAEYDFKRNFGLPFSVKRQMFSDQDGRCANLGCQKVLSSVSCLSG